jgi:3',5'-cyclic AMP phosphodiesterase CpdA
MAKISWLHISDLHIYRPSDLRESEEFDQKEVINSFYDFFLKDYPSQDIQKPQFILITGDLSYCGTKVNFHRSNELTVFNFLEKLIDTLGYSPDELSRRVFPVAGNHDICREDLLLQEEEKMLYNWGKKILNL